MYETLKFGFVPFSFTYPATVEKNTTDKKVTIRASVFRLTKIEMIFALKAESECTIIDEEIHFRSPLPVKFIMKKVFRQQHEKLFKNIDASKTAALPRVGTPACNGEEGEPSHQHHALAVNWLAINNQCVHIGAGSERPARNKHLPCPTATAQVKRLELHTVQI